MDSSSLYNRLLPYTVALFSYASVLAKGHRVFNDPDPYWHIAAGRWIIAHGQVPDRDIFSATMAGAPWIPHEWIAEVAFAFLYDRFGWAALLVATAIAFAATLAILTHALLRYLPPLYAIVGAVTAWGMCFPHVLARPHVFALPLLVLWVDRLVAARVADRAPSPVLALVIVLWANLHGSYIFAFVLIALFAGEALFDSTDRRAALRAAFSWGLFGLLSGAAALVTPHGFSGLLLPFQVTGMSLALSLVNEWQSPNFQEPQPLEAWLMLALLGALFFGVRLPITRIVMLLLLLHMSLRHQRHGEILGLLAPLIVAPALAEQVARDGRGSLMPAWLAGKEMALARVAFAVALVVALAGTLLRRDVAHDRARITPAKAVAAVVDQGIKGPVLNDFNFGGYLIFSGIAPFIDSRFEVYGDAFLARYSRLDELPKLLSEHRIAWTLLTPDSARVAMMDILPGWRRLYADGIAVVHVRADQSR